VSLPLLTCSPLAWPCRLLYRIGRKSRRDLWITLYIYINFLTLIPQKFFSGFQVVACIQTEEAVLKTSYRVSNSLNYQRDIKKTLYNKILEIVSYVCEKIRKEKSFKFSIFSSHVRQASTERLLNPSFLSSVRPSVRLYVLNKSRNYVSFMLSQQLTVRSTFFRVLVPIHWVIIAPLLEKTCLSVS
jgi:hypothetical protein